MAYDSLGYLHTATPQHPDLRGNVSKLIRFHAARRLHLDHAPSAAAIRFQDVDPNENISVLERRLKNRLSWAVGDQLRRVIECRLDVRYGMHHDAFRQRESGSTADIVTELKARERLGIKVARFSAVNLKPKSASAMLERGDF